ncbi:MAG TPA: hypothetical protein VMX55_04930 [candidate division Zixibacteria bacterium]|nr:hypothetical protein [candidate division Zixibacteria bacterium]
MPHVVLNGSINSEKAFEYLENIFLKNELGILKTTNLYLDKTKQAILVESLAIERGQKTGFLAMINNREDGFVVRIYPEFDNFEKTDGVKQILAEIAKQLLEKINNIEIGKNNLQEFL